MSQTNWIILVVVVLVLVLGYIFWPSQTGNNTTTSTGAPAAEQPADTAPAGGTDSTPAPAN